MTVLVTGAHGFIGRHIVRALQSRGDDVLEAGSGTSDDELREMSARADGVVHLAGVNRPSDETEFDRVNRELTERLLGWLAERSERPPVVLSSSTQVALDNPYGRSKRAAEEALERYGRGVAFRLPGVFGKGARPDYNTVIATFCRNVAEGRPSTVSDPQKELSLVYIDDVAAALIAALDVQGFERREAGPVYQRRLGEILAAIESFRDLRSRLLLPDFEDRFLVSLYATYLSYLPKSEFAYDLLKREDERGSLAEFLKSPHVGQIFVSRTKPGVTRGNHWHHTKTEKFLVLEGRAIVRFRHVDSGEVLEYPVAGDAYRVVDIPPGYTHSIENVGEEDLVTLFWASEIFEPERPDTTFEPVLK